MPFLICVGEGLGWRAPAINLVNCKMQAMLWAVIFGLLVLESPAIATEQGSRNMKWVTVWTCSIQAPFPIGTAPSQPQLQFALPGPAFKAHDQTFRMIVRPGFFQRTTRLRFSNWASNTPVTLDDIFVGIQEAGASLLSGENYPVLFGGVKTLLLRPGESTWSDPVNLAILDEREPIVFVGRNMSISFHVKGDARQISWQSEATMTSYITPFSSGSFGSDEEGDHYTIETTSWFFLDAVDMFAPDEALSVVALGDSLTNGTGSTPNADDRWTDLLSLRLRRAYGPNFVVINAGIGGNQIMGPATYLRSAPFPGGPSAIQRLERDVLSLSGVSAIIWSEGINDLADRTASPDSIFSSMRAAVAKLRAGAPSARVLVGTLITALGSEGVHGTKEVDRERRQLNNLIRSADFVDSIIDFDKATIDLKTGELRRGLAIGDAGGMRGDRLHLSRAGNLAMVGAIELQAIMGMHLNKH